MLKYIGKRILLFIPTLIIISFVIFFIIQLPPGDYVTSYVAAMSAEGEVFSAEDLAYLRDQFGLDDPWYVQYFNWVKNILTRGDFGYSFEYGRSVWSVIMDRLYLTLAVSFVILVFQYGVSLPIGSYCANHQYSAGDYALSFIGFIGTATPNFLLAIIIMYWIYVSTGEVYLGLFSTEMLQNGMRWEELTERRVPRLIAGTYPFFSVDTLEYLQKGGRIGKVTAAAGTLLQIKPILTFTEEGQLQSVAKVRGRHQVMDKLVAMTEKSCGEHKRYNLAVANGGALDEMALVKEELTAALPNYDHIWEGQIDGTLSVYIGDGVLGAAVQVLD